MSAPTIDAASVSIVPIATDDPGEAARLVDRDGAAVLTGCGGDLESAAALARVIFGDRVIAAPEPISVREGGDKDPKIRSYDANQVPLPLHTDGFSYGHEMPDVMLLTCVHACATGGESVLVDDLAVIDALAADPATAHLARFATDVELDLTSHGMVPRRGTLIARNPAGRRLLWLPALENSARPLPHDPDAERHTQLLDELLAVFEQVRTTARRIKVAAGETICVDNYRVSHSRDAYDDLRRQFWRIWAWTDDAIGVPDGELASDTRFARADRDES